MKRIVWSDLAKSDVRSLSKIDAVRVLFALHRFAESGTGDVKALQGREEPGYESVIIGSSSSVPIQTPSRLGGFAIAAKLTVDLWVS